jgi:ribose 5-phosphate isomerase B
VDDLGTHSREAVDYPDYARVVGQEVAGKRADCGILVCGSGIGMAMAANKMRGIRAAHVRNQAEAQLSRAHNDANVLTVGGRLLEDSCALGIVDRWLSTAFAGGHHQRRLDKIRQLESAATPGKPGTQG